MSFHLHEGRRAGSLGAVQNWSRAVSCRSRAVPESCRVSRVVPCQPCRPGAVQMKLLSWGQSPSDLLLLLLGQSRPALLPWPVLCSCWVGAGVLLLMAGGLRSTAELGGEKAAGRWARFSYTCARSSYSWARSFSWILMARTWARRGRMEDLGVDPDGGEEMGGEKGGA